ncbi:hypothetical protein CVT25_014287 [Psilocybe cyanescens]|uniref:SH3 domain-containing protein n=1 Tax=Psilocybe cyanescens TaxID=93625 RepID=A0A409XKU6_PSICY|nr:hypothetical protein CVT25_014287 [Psilocybe cyanescens]
MHSKYQRRLPHAERAQLWKRQTETQIIENTASSTGGFVLTAPITLTIVQTVTETGSSTVSTSSTSISSSVGTTSSSTTGQSASSTSTSPLQTPTETLTFSSSISSSFVPPTITPSGMSGGSSATPIAVGSLSSSNELPGGAIAAIVIAVLIALVGIVFYLIRSKSRRTRMKLRPLWTNSNTVNRSGGISSSNYDFKPSGYSEGSNVVGETRQVQSRNSRLSIMIPGADIPVPPNSYNDDNTITINTRSAATTSPTPLVIYSPGSESSSPFGALVVSTFVTRLPDELSINAGEKLRVLAEYDDGWSLCMNNTGEQGMVPVECLSRGSSSQQASLALPLTQSMDRRSSRINSLGRS